MMSRRYTGFGIPLSVLVVFLRRRTPSPATRSELLLHRFLLSDPYFGEKFGCWMEEE